MTKKRFDLKIDQDIRRLFDILNESIISIHRIPTGGTLFEFSDGTRSHVNPDIFNVEWGITTSISRPQDPSSLTNKLCWFWNDMPQHKTIGIYKEYIPTLSYPHKTTDGRSFLFCLPVTGAELKRLAYQDKPDVWKE